MSIGERISDLRAQRNISQVQLAKQLGISRQAVSKWENDLTSPDTLNLIKLADVLDTDVEYLATGNHSTHKAAPEIITVQKPVEIVVEKIVEKFSIDEIRCGASVLGNENGTARFADSGYVS